MPWIPPPALGKKGRNGGYQASEQYIRCDLCRKVTQCAYWGPKKARAVAGVWWPTGQEDQREGIAAWCPRCASHDKRASSSYHCTSLDIEAVMREYWRNASPTGLAALPPPAPPQDLGSCHTPPPRNTVSKAHPGRVPPKAPPPGIPSLATEERLAALEEEVAKLRLSVAELEEYLSGAATGVAARPPP